MRRAQLRLRQLATMVTVALLVGLAVLTVLPHPHVVDLVGRAAALQNPIHRLLPSGIRWY